MNVVLFVRNSPLLLRDVERDAKGRIESGYVVNGQWAFRRVGDEGRAMSGKSIVSRWLQPESVERSVDVPTTFRGDYNNVIAWAERQLVEATK